MAEHKVRLCPWLQRDEDFVDGVVETTAPEPPKLLALNGTLYRRRDCEECEGGRTMYRWYGLLPEVRVTSRG